jgi:hypothetical protein
MFVGNIGDHEKKESDQCHQKENTPSRNPKKGNAFGGVERAAAEGVHRETAALCLRCLISRRSTIVGDCETSKREGKAALYRYPQNARPAARILDTSPDSFLANLC